jgi:heme/copper-type cytochrome/quinol oxidase subunit 2
MLIAGLVAGLLIRILGLGGGILVALQVGAVGAILLIQVLLTVQRCHDFDVSGWLSILFIVIPLAALLLWIIPGTKGPNRYGPPSEPNTTLTVIAGLILPFVVVAGILAAVAIPAYQDYVKRAQQAGQRR